MTAYVVSVGAADAEADPQADPQADAEAIRAALRNRLAAYKIPKQVILVSRLEDVQRLA